MHAGHSLGGALATLASYDLKQVLPDRAQISCYTFGAPRTGEHPVLLMRCSACTCGLWALLRQETALLSMEVVLLSCASISLGSLSSLQRTYFGAVFGLVAPEPSFC